SRFTTPDRREGVANAVLQELPQLGELDLPSLRVVETRELCSFEAAMNSRRAHPELLAERPEAPSARSAGPLGQHHHVLSFEHRPMLALSHSTFQNLEYGMKLCSPVAGAGIEPATPRFSVVCSTN